MSSRFFTSQLLPRTTTQKQHQPFFRPFRHPSSLEGKNNINDFCIQYVASIRRGTPVMTRLGLLSHPSYQNSLLVIGYSTLAPVVSPQRHGAEEECLGCVVPWCVLCSHFSTLESPLNAS